MMNDKQLVSQALAAVLDNALSIDAISNLLETPKKSAASSWFIISFSSPCLSCSATIVASSVSSFLVIFFILVILFGAGGWSRTS